MLSVIFTFSSVDYKYGDFSVWYLVAAAYSSTALFAEDDREEATQTVQPTRMVAGIILLVL